jgi:hypothetical protein
MLFIEKIIPGIPNVVSTGVKGMRLYLPASIWLGWNFHLRNGRTDDIFVTQKRDTLDDL